MYVAQSDLPKHAVIRGASEISVGITNISTPQVSNGSQRLAYLNLASNAFQGPLPQSLQQAPIFRGDAPVLINGCVLVCMCVVLFVCVCVGGVVLTAGTIYRGRPCAHQRVRALLYAEACM